MFFLRCLSQHKADRITTLLLLIVLDQKVVQASIRIQRFFESFGRFNADAYCLSEALAMEISDTSLPFLKVASSGLGGAAAGMPSGKSHVSHVSKEGSVLRECLGGWDAGANQDH